MIQKDNLRAYFFLLIITNKKISNWQVSWIRRDDLHVLTTELMTYTSDKRFQSHHIKGSPFWTLEVNRPTTNDTGVYECQVSSQPKIYRRIRLTVEGEYSHSLIVCKWKFVNIINFISLSSL